MTPGDRLSEYQPSGVTPSYRQTVVHGWGTSLFRPASKSLLSCGNTGAPGRIRTCGTDLHNLTKRLLTDSTAAAGPVRVCYDLGVQR